MQKTPKSLRLHIGIFGTRNAGKSSLLNVLTRQDVAIVSEVAGTTTDPVEKPMEMLPIGPVVFIDTAGIDDSGFLGEKRIEKTKQVFNRTDIGLIVCPQGQWGEFEQGVWEQLNSRSVPAIVVFNKSDIEKPSQAVVDKLADDGVANVTVSCINRDGIADLRGALVKKVPDEFINQPSIVGDLVGAGELVVLVVPIDKEAPKGRIILPQVAVIRDLLDNDSSCIVVKESELADALGKLKEPPAMVITDSQAFLEVAGKMPASVPMTGFSILFARFKGDLNELVNGALAIEDLKSGDKVLIAESCTHHPITEDIGRVKIPKWIQQYCGAKIEFDVVAGHDFPDNLSDYKLAIQCGGCMHNRRAMLSRIMQCRKAGVPITNYGVAIAYSLGIFERALKPFSDSLDYFAETR